MINDLLSGSLINFNFILSLVYLLKNICRSTLAALSMAIDDRLEAAEAVIAK